MLQLADDGAEVPPMPSLPSSSSHVTQGLTLTLALSLSLTLALALALGGICITALVHTCFQSIRRLVNMTIRLRHADRPYRHMR